jgi:hypothetical protein
VLRLWETDIRRDPNDAVARVAALLLFAFYGARLVSVDDGIELDGSSGSALALASRAR